MIFRSPPLFGQCSMSILKTRLSNLAQLRGSGRWCAQFVVHSACCVFSAGACRSLAPQRLRPRTALLKAMSVELTPGRRRGVSA